MWVIRKVESEVAQSCPPLCDPMDCGPPGSSVHGIFLARILECIAIPFSRGIFQTQGSNLSLLNCRKILYHLSTKEAPLFMLLLLLSRFSHVRLCVTLWTEVHQAPLSMQFSRQEYWSRLPCPPPGDLLNPRIGPTSLMSSSLAGRFFTSCATWEIQGPYTGLREINVSICTFLGWNLNCWLFTFVLL